MAAPTPRRARPPRPTITDVARAAGVSRGTVSRVLNGARYVSPSALAAVNEAIRATGYQANSHARSLVTGRSNSVAFVLTEPQHLLFEDPTFSIMLRAAAQALAQRDIPLVLMVAGSEEERRRTTTYVAAGHVDGVLLVSTHAGSPLLRDLLSEHVPVVTSGAPLGFDAVGYVEADEIGGARAMVRHLVERGRSTIATVTGPLDTPGGLKRLEGYRLEMADRLDESLIAHGDYSRESGRRATAELLARRPDIDAIFVASDLMAAGAVTALAEHGRRVPEDVAVGGFDDTGMAAALHPPLTTVRQPLDRIAREQVRLLLEIIDGQEPAAITLPTQLVVRAST
ncbi:LacI family transcriptional regulator [Actinotalea sp. M2MS4P-6]|uniref:LacI family DNA-binding transcriptional regulator n=1 Tax=Actinotalea sp. M2MS4P-6 TaxID=2983762 RepID=UPI0021E3FD3E|nr:LacI family DNA-binding transcriptional regulator [Actinotalea sp. M2MS4P-6]MCV2393283.1 LacI family transcriptional regulator [Actinotalea sp. M2MS4P-6]